MQQKFYPQNENIQVFIKDKLYPRSEAKISVFDSAVQGGDAVWEGLRIYDGKVFCLNEHINRLQASAHTLAFADIPSKEFVRDAIFQTLKANNFYNDAHIRLTLTRGEKITSGMDPRLNQFGSCLIVLAEYKPPVYDNANGIKLITSHTRRNSPMHLDSKIHHNNLLNNILAKIEANYCGADDAIMLDNLGFVAETNACNIFMVKDGLLLTPNADACLPGITRTNVIKLAQKLNIPVALKNISIAEFYNADEVFTTGTMGELTPVKEIDGRAIQNKSSSTIREQLYKAYKELTEKEGEKIV
ncbi:aminotransferase class IV [Parafilimonas terrae]|uniref:branched-chain-amino-acid transaminase n=1 Tax=Parafilimonas terrae TaxID=1465490 RepID=A0A1I5ZB01_9BACT|nr:aminotransferase class IV [Parafilimonas terrae]SFQ53623.1 branched-chain amino acid aminotransferase [Parafilimonas terrae]